MRGRRDNSRATSEDSNETLGSKRRRKSTDQQTHKQVYITEVDQFKNKSENRQCCCYMHKKSITNKLQKDITNFSWRKPNAQSKLQPVALIGHRKNPNSWFY